MSDDIKLPELGQTYNLIATYSVRHDHLSDIDRLSKWQELINSIKDYARAAVELNRAVPDGFVLLQKSDVQNLVSYFSGADIGIRYGAAKLSALRAQKLLNTTAPEHGEG